jgi:hypothetical protein
MATVISILHPDPQPQRGESGLVLSLSFRPPSAESDEQGYRMVARVEETGRVIGRWVSDCALTITETALLWCSKTLDEQGEPMWSFAIAEDSLDWQRVLDTVQEYAPGEQPGLPPRRAVLVLAGNFPDQVAQPAPRRALPGPAQIRRAGQPAPQPEAQPAPPSRMIAGASRQAPAAQQRPAPKPKPEPVELGEEEQELTEVVREMYRALKSGASADEVRAAMLEVVGIGDEDEDEDEDDLTTWDDEEEDDEEDDEEGDEDEEDEEDDEDADEEEAEAPAEEDMLAWEKGMRLYGADQRAYEKLQRTRQRQNELLSRVYASLTPEQIAEGRNAARPVQPEAAPDPVKLSVVEQAEQQEPKAPKPRRQLRQLADTLVAAEAEPALAPVPEPVSVTEPLPEESPASAKRGRRRKASA